MSPNSTVPARIKVSLYTLSSIKRREVEAPAFLANKKFRHFVTFERIVSPLPSPKGFILEARQRKIDLTLTTNRTGLSAGWDAVGSTHVGSWGLDRKGTWAK